MSRLDQDVSNTGSGIPTVERSDYYLKVLSFVASNAWCGENIAIENYSEMVPLMESVDHKIEVVHQAKEEAKHVLILEKLARNVGFSIDQGMLQEDWPKVRAAFHEAAQKRDLAACLIIQDLMIESLAIGLYSTFASDDNKDLETRRAAENLLKDELDHLEIGLRRIGELKNKDSEAVHDSLVWAHTRVVPCLFNMVHTACDFLCEKKGLPCDSRVAFVQDGSLYLGGEERNGSYIDLNRLKVASLENYVSMLDRGGFNVSTTNQLIAGMAAYEVKGRETLGVEHLLKMKMPASGNMTH